MQGHLDDLVAWGNAGRTRDAGALLTVVIAASALTLASPLREGIVVKVLFLSGLAWAAFRAAQRDADDLKFVEHP